MIRGSDSSGFTLVELLVATTLLALLSVILFGGLRFGARAWESGGDSIERTGEIEAVQELLRRTLVEAVAPEHSGTTSQTAFAGASSQVAFYAPMPRHVGLGGFGRYALWLDQTGQLLLGWEPRRPERKLGIPVAGEPAAILQNLQGLRISYYGAGEPGEAPAWQAEWESNALPLLIRIDVAFADADARRWPELIIAPRLARIVGG
ncbi:MAG TPA: prepilin-type N-terminal cleavage/methylation domain-containing protein [Alphaproteobacteria bacterium]|jgi:general secretion pathway protein J|nr:prepilin-type N-terminal cleavage/methylation domain-containing protein [Alphaproteobacteria bacterium]